MERALVAFPLEYGEATDRGLVLAWTHGGTLERVIGEGMKPPPRYGHSGLRVWEGRVWLADEAGAPEHPAWRDGVLFDGEWRRLTDDEWASVREARWP